MSFKNVIYFIIIIIHLLVRKKNYKEPQRFIRPPGNEKKKYRCYSSENFNRLHSHSLEKSHVPVDNLTKNVWLVGRTEA